MTRSSAGAKDLVPEGGQKLFSFIAVLDFSHFSTDLLRQRFYLLHTATQTGTGYFAALVVKFVSVRFDRSKQLFQLIELFHIY